MTAGDDGVRKEMRTFIEDNFIYMHPGTELAVNGGRLDRVEHRLQRSYELDRDHRCCRRFQRR